MSRVGAGQEQGRSCAEQSKAERAERGSELGRNWGGARNVLDSSLKGAGPEYGRGRAEVGAGKARSRRRE